MEDEEEYPEEPLDDKFGWRAHKACAPAHSDNLGHYCTSWDYLWICSDCDEFECCNCFENKGKNK